MYEVCPFGSSRREVNSLEYPGQSERSLSQLLLHRHTLHLKQAPVQENKWVAERGALGNLGPALDLEANGDLVRPSVKSLKDGNLAAAFPKCLQTWEANLWPHTKCWKRALS